MTFLQGNNFDEFENIAIGTTGHILCFRSTLV